MGKNFTGLFAIALAISALPLACGDDEDDGGSGGKGGGTSTGGTGGKATGGSSGKATGGSAGKGTGGTSGTGTGGKATGGTSTGGTSTGGTTPGGAGGEGGAMGGEGGGPAMSVCDRFCDAGEVANCSHTHESCVTECAYIYSYGVGMDPACQDLLDAAYECAIAGTSATTDWTCNQNQPNYIGGECFDEVTAAADAYCYP